MDCISVFGIILSKSGTRTQEELDLAADHFSDCADCIIDLIEIRSIPGTEYHEAVEEAMAAQDNLPKREAFRKLFSVIREYVDFFGTASLGATSKEEED